MVFAVYGLMNNYGASWQGLNRINLLCFIHSIEREKEKVSFNLCCTSSHSEFHHINAVLISAIKNYQIPPFLVLIPTNNS